MTKQNSLVPFEQDTGAVSTKVEKTGEGLIADAGSHVQIIPRLYVVQEQTEDEDRKALGDGTLLILPDAELVAPFEGEIKAVPLFGWIDYRTVRDNKDKDGFWILERSADPDSEIAKKSQAEELREEAYGPPTKKDPNGKYTMKHQQCFNVILGVVEGPFAGLQAVYTWVSGSWSIGRDLVAKLNRDAQQRGLDAYRRVVTFATAKKKGQQGTFYVLNFKREMQIVNDEKAIEKLKGMHTELVQQYSGKILKVVDEKGETPDSETQEVEAADATDA